MSGGLGYVDLRLLAMVKGLQKRIQGVRNYNARARNVHTFEYKGVKFTSENVKGTDGWYSDWEKRKRWLKSGKAEMRTLRRKARRKRT